jgi:4-amino-4-deoxy-L-arabinose transferase-like glycosyltransferase
VTTQPASSSATAARWSAIATALLLCASAVLLGAHYLHLRADFPHASPWPDPARFTDEGWYAGAAIRQMLSGSWYLRGDFNPAVPLPVFPLLAYILFRVTGVSVAALRAMNVTFFALTLVCVWQLLRRRAGALPAAGAVFLCCCSPFYYAYSRLGILEPLLALETLLVFLVALSVDCSGNRRRCLLQSCAAGFLLTTMVLTKTTGVCIFPAVLFLILSRCDFDFRLALRPWLITLSTSVVSWTAYYALVHHNGFGADYHNLFLINRDRVHSSIVFSTMISAVREGATIGTALYGIATAVTVLALLLVRSRSPLLVAALIGIAGYGAFITYHGWLMPRYYIPAMPLVVIAAILSLTELARSTVTYQRILGATLGAALLVSTLPQIRTLLTWSRNPSYSYAEAAGNIYQVIDRTNDHPGNRVVFGPISESLALYTAEHGLFLNDMYGTIPRRDLVRLYQPGWFVSIFRFPTNPESQLEGYATPQLLSTEAAFGADGHPIYLYRLDPTPTH